MNSNYFLFNKEKNFFSYSKVVLLVLSFFFLVQQSKANAEIFNQLIVQAKQDVSVAQLLAPTGLVVDKTTLLSKSMNICLLEFANNESAYAAKQFLAQQKEIIAVQYNHRLQYRSASPVDSFYNLQWYMHNTGLYGYVAGTDINAEAAWDTTKGGITKYGDSIVVAIVDGKFDLTHKDLRYFQNHNEIPLNGIDDDGDGYIDNYAGWSSHTHNDDIHTSVSSHATQLAGIVAAIHDNKGIAGVNDGIRILPIYSNAVESEVVEAYGYIVDMRKLYELTSGAKGAYIVASNSSFGINTSFPIDFPIWCAMYDSMGKYGVVSAAATINDVVNVDIYGDMPTACASNFLISVTELTGTNTLGISGYGDSCIDIAAPGVNIISTIANNGYSSSNGTSYSTPMVAGAVALLMSHACENFLDLYALYPDSAALLLKQYILSSATLVPDLAGKIKTGGRLDLFHAIEAMNTFDCTSCEGTISFSAQNSLCDNNPSGYVHATVSPSNTILHYLWSTGDTTLNIDSLDAGAYTLSITDTNGCVRVKRFNIQAPSPLLLDSIYCLYYNESHPGSIYMRGHGGTAPYQFSIDGIAYHSGTYYSGLAPGTYPVSIRDANGCITDTNIVVENRTGIQELHDGYAIRLLSNLSNSMLVLKVMDETPMNHALSYQIVSLQGQAMSMQAIDNKGFTSMEQKIDVSLLANGLYLLNVYDGDKRVLTLKFGKY